MKKFILFLLAISNLLIFLIILSVYEEKDVSDIYNFRNFRDDVFRTTLTINNTENLIEQNSFMDFINQLREKYQLTIFYEDFDYEKNNYNLFIDSNEDIDQLLSLVTNTSLNFKENSEKYYSNIALSTDAVYTFILNNRIELSIRPLSQLKSIPSGNFEFIADAQDDLDQALSEFLESYGEFIYHSDIYVNDSLDVKMALDDLLPFTLVTSLSCLLLLFLILVQSNAKKIAIFQTLGFSSFKIFQKLFASFFFYCLGVIAASQTILYWTFIGAFNIRTTPITTSLSLAAIYQVMGIVIIFLIAFSLLKFIPKYSLLKNSNFTRILMNVNYSLQIITLILLLPILAPKIDSLIFYNSLFQYAYSIQEDNYQYAQLTNQYGFKYDTFDDLMEYISNRDPNIINQSAVLELQALTYDALTNEGALLYSMNPILLGNNIEVPSAHINENYIERFPLYLPTGEVFNVDSTTANVIYLIPESYLEQFSSDSFLNDIYANEYEIVPINDEQSFLDFSFIRTAQFSELPYVFQLYKSGSYRLENSIFNDVYYSGDFEQAISQTEFANKVDIFNTQDDLENLKNHFQASILDSMKTLAPGILLVILIISEYVYFYKKVNLQRISIKKILGFSNFRNYFPLLIEFSSIFFITLIIAIFKNIDVRLISSLTLLYIIIYLLIVFLPDKKKLT